MIQVVTCEGCYGKGYVKCPICDGKGRIKKKESSTGDSGYVRILGATAECPQCREAGRLLCTVCGGAGKVKVETPSSPPTIRTLF